jgi:hypothetical protein
LPVNFDLPSTAIAMGHYQRPIEKGMMVNLIINNRAGGNAPMIAQEIAVKSLAKPKAKTPHQMNLRDLRMCGKIYFRFKP